MTSKTIRPPLQVVCIINVGEGAVADKVHQAAREKAFSEVEKATNRYLGYILLSINLYLYLLSYTSYSTYCVLLYYRWKTRTMALK